MLLFAARKDPGGGGAVEMVEMGRDIAGIPRVFSILHNIIGRQ